MPLLLGLAALGLNDLLVAPWPRLSVSFSVNLRYTLRPTLILLLVPLLWSLKSVVDFSTPWLGLDPLPTDSITLAEALHQPEAAWVQPPYGDILFVTIGLQHGLKLTQAYRAWTWREHEPPAAAVEATHDVVQAPPAFQHVVAGTTVLSHPEQSYAAIQTGTTAVPCHAQATGGNITVTCDSAVAGTLLVQENAWSGWTVQRDGEPAALDPGRWLQTAAPAGPHIYHFYYRPWDVLVGLALSTGGVLLALYLWWTPARSSANRLRSTSSTKAPP